MYLYPVAERTSPLSDQARRLRRNLLLVAGIAYTLWFFDIEITAFPALGVTSMSPKAVPIILFVLVTYHMVSFTWTALHDLRSWIDEMARERDRTYYATARSEFAAKGFQLNNLDDKDTQSWFKENIEPNRT